jgi:6,7-dimethyl-8-ribityllumazine synthase
LIKALYILRTAGNQEQFLQLQRFFETLAFARAESWEGRSGKAVLFRAPQTGIEVGLGDNFPGIELLCEVADANSAYELMQAQGFPIAEQIADHPWGGRMFVVEPAPGRRIALFSYLPEKRPRRQTSLEGTMDARGLRFGIVVSRFNSFITERLVEGALDALHRSGAGDQDITIVRVPGAFEIPSAARTLAETGRVDALICLGCLIRGETTHYEHIATECTRGIGQAAQETGIPHAYGVLTCENLEQAIDRAGLKAGNKGFEAALAAIEMASLKKKLAAKS